MTDTRDVTPETCIVAAVRGADGQIVRCLRHYQGLMVLNEAQRTDTTQGFITSRNRFVDRHEGMRLQLAAGIASVAEGGYRGHTLFSEDLY